MQKIEVVRGLTMPFLPMQPTRGRSLRAPRLIDELAHEIRTSKDWVVQPWMAGDRVAVAVVDKKVYVQNDTGGWYKKHINQTHDFLRLPNRTVLEGVVYENDFYPFDLLALDAKSFLLRCASEREAMAFQMVRFIGRTWYFPRPTATWMMQRTSLLPKYKGVILKDSRSQYIPATSTKQVSLLWFSRKWS